MREKVCVCEEACLREKCVCVREREDVCVCEKVCVRGSLCVRERERERSVCVIEEV